MKVHIYGDVECKLCEIRFTKRSLEIHDRRFHLDVQRKDRVLKALQRHLYNEVMYNRFTVLTT